MNTRTKTRIRTWSRGLAAFGALALTVIPAPTIANGKELPFDVAKVFFELNHTDGDLGIHALVDGGPWKRMFIENQNGYKILHVKAWGKLKRQGLTEIFFESAEPEFSELRPEEFFRRFREGVYEIEGVTLDNKELESETEVTHTMPAPAEPLVNGQAAPTNCDEEDPGFNIIQVDPPVTISWSPVTVSHPDLGTMPPVPVSIHNYEVVVEFETEVNGQEFVSIFSVILPPENTSVSVPAELIALTDSFKFEVLAREESYNQTAVESCFEVN